jgi:protein ImuB
MTLAQARSMLPTTVARGRDVMCERSAHEALLEVAWSLSPRVEDAAEDLVFADITGTEGLCASEEELGRRAMARAGSLDLTIRVGVAATKLAARIAAHLPCSPLVVPHGGEGDFLADLPLAHLQLDRALRGTLHRWGITTIGALAGLPAAEVASRLGRAGATAHRAARGLDAEPLVPCPAPSVLTEGLELEWPVVTVEPLLYAIRQCLDRVHERLAREEAACALLELELGLEPEGTTRRVIRLPSPTCDMDAVLGLVRLDLEQRPPGAAVAALACAVHPDQPRRAQLTLFGPAEIPPDRLAGTLVRLAARIGPDRLGSPRTVDGHRPERCATADFSPPRAPTLRPAHRRGRGLLAVRTLRPAVPLEVITDRADPGDGPDGARTHLDLRDRRLISVASTTGATPRIQGLVRVAAGPWQMEEGWWSDRPLARAYWDVELSDGGLYRLYCDQRSGEWFADGVYD